MTQEEKDLLIKDICGRLPYKPILINKQLSGGYPQKCFPGYLGFGKFIDISKIDDTKIYLRSMSSMTEEEKQEYHQKNQTFRLGVTKVPIEFHLYRTQDAFDWLNKKMFDYRGLIKRGLALEAPEGMYKIS